jgi:hypothetical protein
MEVLKISENSKAAKMRERAEGTEIYGKPNKCTPRRI